jgi:hypothetical protein
LPAASRLLPARELSALQHAFARRKLAALRAGRRGGWRLTTGVVLGALAGAAVVALAAAAWRNGTAWPRRGQTRTRRATSEDVGHPRSRDRPMADERRLHVL